VNKAVPVPTERFFRKEHTWLCGIPAGLIHDSASGGLDGILEIKCRFPKHEHAIDTTVPYQTMSQIYYYMPQVQGYLEILDCSYCDLLSYTPRGSTVFRIYRVLGAALPGIGRVSPASIERFSASCKTS